MEVIDKFYLAFEDVKGFDWKPEWDILMGVENPFDYVRELVDVNSLDKYVPDKHLRKSFTGFVRADKENLEMHGSIHMVDFMYLEKGKPKYFQCHEGNETLYSKKFGFYGDTFCIRKAYDSQEGGKLSLVHRDVRFKLDGFGIEVSRRLKEKSTVYVFTNPDLFFEFHVSGERADKFNAKMFEDYQEFVNTFKDLKGEILGKKGYFGKTLNFIEGMELIRE